ncbi:response regulator transcription factor [Sporomusa malonica]|uniref:DNA-binding response regulator, OmpR family, contains REC and winged-helix (WHTH) domain n=1 Tax=Sporomusa malonica TaxID=112901 RepID=A0A1W2DW33_9FIRM|nr:response regulator transcription factor [Sporomusa malonica]SMD01694.1 DNA-binding response regulator, OmpR family, contains REC and winged-helix (wHTH) domain [Sporomusa malonica]
MRILLAEDDAKLGNLIKRMLEKAEVQVDWVTQGDTAIEYAIHSPYDVIVLDWMMPVKTGIEVCDHLRKGGYQGSILMLTAKDDVVDRVLGLDTGADDYLVKPFEFVELLARLRALSRRSSTKLKEDIVQLGDLILNRSSRSVQFKETEVQLTSREFQLLDLLVQNKGQVVPREVILDRVWGLESDVSPNNLDAYVRLLRRKINLPEGDVVIQNVRGVGFKLEAHHVC